MSSEDLSGPMKAGMSKCFDTGQYSDLRVQCKNGDTYKVHKFVLCNQSHVFKTACDPERGFKEANEGIIHLEEDDPETVRALLEFLYRFKYAIPEGSGLLFHVRAYVIGEIYGVDGIKDLAKRHFKKLAWTSWGCSTFPLAVQAIYNTTPESDRGLRDLAVEVAAAHVEELLDSESYRAMMDEVGSFGKDLTRAIYQSPSVKEKEIDAITSRYGKYRCPGGCGLEVEMVLPTDTRYIYCMRCGSQFSSWSNSRR